jgi:putative ABC transport system substrate-binding protein
MLAVRPQPPGRKMKRREVISLLGSAMLAWPFAALAQTPKKVPRVGYLFSFVRSQGQHLWEACRQGLRELGYAESKNIVLEPRWSEGHNELLPILAAELVRLNVDVIVSAATPASRAAKSATGTIPIVFVAVADPIRAGLVASYRRPGENATGISLLTPELSGKRLQIIAEIVPRTKRVVVLTNPDNLSHAVFLEETMAAGETIGVHVEPLRARNSREIEREFGEISKHEAQALIVFDDPAIWSQRKQVVALAEKIKIPAMYGYSEFVSDGGLISYGPYRPDLYRRTAGYVDKILKGTKPAGLPVERPIKFELFVNLITAKALGIKMPASVLLQADKILE